MKKQTKLTDIDLEIARCELDPWRFVLFAFDWGEGELANKWPEKWQEEVLKSIRDKLKNSDRSSINWYCLIREAIAAGNGVGKSAFFSWVIIWALSTKVDTRITVTANTATQLSTKTWPTLKTWARRSIVADRFEVTATAMFAKDTEHIKTWRADAVPWSEHNPESFAGLHNEGKRLVVIFDEASAIADKIWEETEGALTDANTEIIFLAGGNPTRTRGRFRECFTKYRSQWNPKHVDSRDISFTNKDLIKAWERTETDDFFRVHVSGDFPEQDIDALISLKVIESAINKDVSEDGELVYGVDVGRMGSDPSVICKRQGNKVPPLLVYRKKKNTELAGIVKVEALEDKPDRINIDVIGVGSGVVDILDDDADINVSYACHVGESADDPKRFKNRRAELHWMMKEWFDCGDASIPDDPLLIEELEVIEYTYTSSGQIQVMSKDKIKAEIGRSPDRSDSLMMTFYRPVERGLGVICV